MPVPLEGKGTSNCGQGVASSAKGLKERRSGRRIRHGDVRMDGETEWSTDAWIDRKDDRWRDELVNRRIDRQGDGSVNRRIDR